MIISAAHRMSHATTGRSGMSGSGRRPGVPLARIRDILALEPAAAAEEIRAHWTEAEAEHAAQRVLIDRLVDRFHGKKSAMYEVTVRDIPERSVLSLVSRVHQDELEPRTRELFIHRLRGGGVPRVEGIAGAPFTIYHGEVSGDSDGPVEWCRPVPGDRAAEIAAGFPDLTLRTEPAHQEAFVRPQTPGRWAGGTQVEVAVGALFAWAAEHHRHPSGGVRGVLVPDPAGRGTGPYVEFALSLR
ncbi:MULTISPECIES: hypothetical protein [unclassified Streptomyces]|uniref:hypothetical protein n=1 Tax=unclassified Streptomyces TaxID=2593676 RepID=UPI002E2CD943|nr:hypothetical protein [Streptomyces sp. NBC_00223]